MSVVAFDVSALRKAIQKRMESPREHVLSGKCATLEEYKAKTGLLQGLDAALTEINNTIKETEDEA